MSMRNILLAILAAEGAAVLFSYFLKITDSPAVVAMAVASNPLFAMALTHPSLPRETIAPKKIIGCVVTIAGLTLLAK